MGSLNRVLLIGNLTKDPELRHIPSGTALAELRLAVSESYKNRNRRGSGRHGGVVKTCFNLHVFPS